jgi:hypothetical protein
MIRGLHLGFQADESLKTYINVTCGISVVRSNRDPNVVDAISSDLSNPEWAIISAVSHHLIAAIANECLLVSQKLELICQDDNPDLLMHPIRTDKPVHHNAPKNG